jgi:hypothetical protein
MRRHSIPWAFAFFAFLGLSSTAIAADEEGFAWQDAEGDHIDLYYNGQPAIRYMQPKLDETSDETRNATFKPYHHVFSPDGKTLLTKGPGGLFPHHKGLFYGFNKISYGDGKKCDTWHCTGKTFQEGVSEIKHEADADSASHQVAIDWHGEDGEVFAHEKRTIGVTRDEVDGVEGWLIDFGSHLETADGKPVHLDGDPQHAGFQFRATQEVPDKTAKETYYLRPDGKGEPGKFRNWDHAKPDATENAKTENMPWNALSMVVDGRRYTVVYLDHPDNPKPARYSERDYGRFGSYFVADVTKDQPLEVKYRLWVQPGEMTVEQCEALSKAFIEEAPAAGD